MSSTRISRDLPVPPSAVYAALIDPDAVAKWMVPDGMTRVATAYEVREGGAFRVTLTYDEPSGAGKTTAHSDTYHGSFVRLVPDREVIQEIEFETEDPSMQGRMRIEFHLEDIEGSTRLTAEHNHLPPGLSAVDNEIGWNMALDKLEGLLTKPVR